MKSQMILECSNENIVIISIQMHSLISITFSSLKLPLQTSEISIKEFKVSEIWRGKQEGGYEKVRK